MTKLIIEIDISGDTFGDTDSDRSCGTEISAILRSIATDVDHESRRELNDRYPNTYGDTNGNEVARVEVKDYKPRRSLLEWIDHVSFNDQLRALNSLAPDMKITIGEAYSSNLKFALEEAIKAGDLTVADLYDEHNI